MRMHIQDGCGCVRRISMQCYRTASSAGSSWQMANVLPQTACADHAAAASKQLAALMLDSPGSTVADVIQRNAGPTYVQSALAL
jgi:hypothetical protein